MKRELTEIQRIFEKQTEEVIHSYRNSESTFMPVFLRKNSEKNGNYVQRAIEFNGSFVLNSCSQPL